MVVSFRCKSPVAPQRPASTDRVWPWASRGSVAPVATATLATRGRPVSSRGERSGRASVGRWPYG
eukprot:12366434-Heterocapsa_arctica.AAC.1